LNFEPSIAIAALLSANQLNLQRSGRQRFSKVIAGHRWVQSSFSGVILAQERSSFISRT
jgi:hypothetical protein